MPDPNSSVERPMMDSDDTPWCYDSVSNAMRQALTIAKGHVDAPTWNDLLRKESEVVTFDLNGGSAPFASGDAFWLTQSPMQQLPWEPGMFCVKSDIRCTQLPEERELRSILAGKTFLPSVFSILEEAAARFATMTAERALSAGAAGVEFQVWSVPRTHGHTPGTVESLGGLRLGAAFTLADMAHVGGMFIMPWPRMFGCPNCVIPDLRSLFVSVRLTTPKDAEPPVLDSLSLRISKVGTSHMRRMENALRDTNV